MSLEKNRDMARRHMANVAHDPLKNRYCPVCGRESQVKYFDEKTQEYVYVHKKAFESSVYHRAKA